MVIKSTIDFRGNQINNRYGIRIFQIWKGCYPPTNLDKPYKPKKKKKKKDRIGILLHFFWKAHFSKFSNHFQGRYWDSNIFCPYNFFFFVSSQQDLNPWPCGVNYKTLSLSLSQIPMSICVHESWASKRLASQKQRPLLFNTITTAPLQTPNWPYCPFPHFLCLST